MDDPNNQAKSKLPEFKWKHFWIYAGVAIVIIIGVFGFYFWKFNEPLSTSQTTWGVFGDFIGGTLNPLLAFMGLIALLYTIIIQSSELKETREELGNSTKALQAQSESLKLQNF